MARALHFFFSGHTLALACQLSVLRSSLPLSVQMQGYDNLELRAKLPADQQQIPLSLTFPEGPMIGVAKERVPVLLSFTADKPTAFTAKVEFADSAGAKFSLPITGTADNSILTVEPFLTANRAAIEFAAEGNRASISLVPKPYHVPQPGPDSFLCLGPFESSPNLARFLSASAGIRGLTDATLVQSILAAKGGLVLDLVERFSGKPVPNRVSHFSQNRREAADQCLGNYERLLSFLKSHGALLNAIKPEFLLDEDDFLRIVQSKSSKASTPHEEDQANFWQQMLDRFEELSRRRARYLHLPD